MIKIQLDGNDKNNFYLRIPFEDSVSRDKAKRIGGLWQPSKKAWKFVFDLRIWETVSNTFKDNLEKPTIFNYLLNQKKKEEQLFLSAKEIAQKNQDTDFAVKGVEINGKNCLFNYQRHGVNCAIKTGDGFLIGDQPGLGKSIQGIGISIERKNLGLISNCLIVCPASLKYNWLNEVHKFTKETALVIDGTKQDRQKKWFAKGYFFKIANYETIVSDLFLDTKGKSKNQRIQGADAVLSSFDMICVDEVHYLKSVSSLRSKALKQFKTKYRLGLTGTPIDGKLEDIQALFDFIKPGLFPTRSKFLQRYADLDFWGAVKRYKNIQQVKDKINPYYLRRTKDVVLKDLPPKIFKDIYVQLGAKEKKLYNDILKGKSQVTEQAEAAVLMMRLRQFCDFPEILDFRNPSAKFAALSDLLHELIIENKEKVVIFTQYKTVLDLLYKNLKDDYNILQIHGDVKTKDRFQLCEKFNNDPSVNIMLGDDAMSVGLNMQNGKSVIHYQDNFSPAVMQQRNDRCHRATTKHNVTIYRFVVKDTVEEKLRQALERKMKVVNAVLDENCTEFETGEKITNLEIISNL